ncbi:cupredoxin domain-containing protein [Brevibacillus reuszeri]|uniref:cupredoxin domain-containing protein n=1 Tax=Brevibacillus reuszeri TaxID=54915 RepID=UPI003D21EC4D
MRHSQMVIRLSVLICGSAAIMYMLAGPNSGQPEQAGKTPAMAQLQIEDRNDLQTAEVKVNGQEFSPEHIKLTAGVLAKVNFRLDPCENCNKQLVSEELDINSTLREGDNFFLMRNLRPGAYTFKNGTGQLAGTITVVASSETQAPQIAAGTP